MGCKKKFIKHMNLVLSRHDILSRFVRNSTIQSSEFNGMPTFTGQNNILSTVYSVICISTKYL